MLPPLQPLSLLQSRIICGLSDTGDEPEVMAFQLSTPAAEAKA